MADPRPQTVAEAAAAQRSPILREVKAKRPWPPDFSKMSETDRYRLERKYKRRMRKGHPAGWMKFTGILQILTVTALPAYMILFMDWKMEHPFGPIREWMWSKIGSFNLGQDLVRASAVPDKTTTSSKPADSR
ncbi:hypothetical protein TWF696_000441 [Orbilia brochopaga]|uniref:Uncharacterized protein n=1 Tax=Orbilia brochopaga TaxID=3140254 RepID=A0AAV9VCJ4_9PEZI